MTHHKFDTAKQKYIEQGFPAFQSAKMAAIETGETDGSVDLPLDIDTEGWTKDDWYQHYISEGNSEDDARFWAAVAVNEIDLNDPKVDY